MNALSTLSTKMMMFFIYVDYIKLGLLLDRFNANKQGITPLFVFLLHLVELQYKIEDAH